MDAATDAIIRTWAERGLVGSVVIALAVVAIMLWRKVDALHEARRVDSKECTDRYTDMLAKTIESNNRMADGMEAFERVVDKVVKT
jgi:hypothetical protein